MTDLKAKADELMKGKSNDEYKYDNLLPIYLVNHHNINPDYEAYPITENIMELEEIYYKARLFNNITNAINATWIEYPEDWMSEVLMIVRNYEEEFTC